MCVFVLFIFIQSAMIIYESLTFLLMRKINETYKVTLGKVKLDKYYL